MTRWSLAFALLFLTACEQSEESAKTIFSEENTCPLARVETRARKDLSVSSFAESSPPPADIAADPGRLQMWKDNQAKANGSDDDWHIVEARGCDKHVFYKCAVPSRSTAKTRYMCMSESTVPKSVTGWP